MKASSTETSSLGNLRTEDGGILRKGEPLDKQLSKKNIEKWRMKRKKILNDLVPPITMASWGENQLWNHHRNEDKHLQTTTTFSYYITPGVITTPLILPAEMSNSKYSPMASIKGFASLSCQQSRRMKEPETAIIWLALIRICAKLLWGENTFFFY